MYITGSNILKLCTTAHCFSLWSSTQGKKVGSKELQKRKLKKARRFHQSRNQDNCQDMTVLLMTVGKNSLSSLVASLKITGGLKYLSCYSLISGPLNKPGNSVTTFL